MDHISKALERARTENGTVRNWMRPSEEPANAPLEGPVPEVVTSPERLQAHHILCGTGTEDPVVADRYRLLRTRVTQIMKARGWEALGVTSAGPRAGKTVTSINLAISLARDGAYTVVLVDGDLRKPSVARYLGFTPELGLVDHLADDVPLEDICVQLDIKNLVVLPGRDSKAPDKVPELLHSERLTTTMQSLRHMSSSCLVVVDLPPVLVGDDVIATGPRLDALLMVIEEAGTDVDDLKKSMDLIADFSVLGTVLNKSAEQMKGADGYAYYAAAPKRG